MKKQYIELKGVRVHNLKNIDLKIDLNKLIVITGVSGSGKSSLAFDTLYAEGQRRYVESLSSYARQFLGRLDKPKCDYIKGIPPAIAIEQKVNTSNARSTVGTFTEIYDYLKLLFARAGKIYSPISGKEVVSNSIDKITSNIIKNYQDVNVLILARPNNMQINENLEELLKRGFIRVLINNKIERIEDIITQDKKIHEESTYLVIDRISVDKEKDTYSRIAESVELAMTEGHGRCFIKIGDKILEFSSKLERDGIVFNKPTVNTFSFNSPIGACPVCNGYGRILGIDEDLVIPNKALSVYENTIMCWRGEKMSYFKKEIIKNASKVDFPIHTPYYELPSKFKKMLWNGCEYFSGINDFFKELESKKYKIQNRVMIARYTGKTICPQCEGTRLKPEANYIKISGKSIADLVKMQISDLYEFFENIVLSDEQIKISESILPEIINRLRFLMEVGLDYLTLNRLSSTLSGGESQRINITKSLGSALVGSLYVLDEPSIGLHSRDTERLINVLKDLRDLGNTVVVVEHDEDIMKSADKIIDIGPSAGNLGGEIVFEGTIDKLKTSNTLTSDYLFGKREIAVPKRRRKSFKKITIHGATQNNLKNITVDIPLNIMTVVTGVSGSGKSTLIKNILLPAIRKHFDLKVDNQGSYDKITGDIDDITGIEYVDQNPIGKTSRSNPVTYIKAWDDIRKLFSLQKQAIFNNLTASSFSFNTPGGRCEECQGEGVVKVSMQFMADLYLTCEQCHGKRFNEDVLEVKFKDKNIFDILEMTINQAIEFFDGDNATERSIIKKISKLADVGLSYVKLGQSSNTLSGGECQRIKLAYFLSMETINKKLFVFDEPTTGLHFHDINKLMKSITSLLDRGHTVVVIEHNMDVIKCADNIIDLGPEGGLKGGRLIFEGKPEDLINIKESYTGRYLKEKLK